MRGEETECREFGQLWRKLAAKGKREIMKWLKGGIRSRKVSFLSFLKIAKTEPCANTD